MTLLDQLNQHSKDPRPAIAAIPLLSGFRLDERQFIALAAAVLHGQRAVIASLEAARPDLVRASLLLSALDLRDAQSRFGVAIGDKDDPRVELEGLLKSLQWMLGTKDLQLPAIHRAWLLGTLERHGMHP